MMPKIQGCSHRDSSAAAALLRRVARALLALAPILLLVGCAQTGGGEVTGSGDEEVEAFWIDRRPARLYDQSLTSDLVPPGKERKQYAPSVAAGKAARKYMRPDRLAIVIEALEDQGFYDHAKAEPEPNWFQVLGIRKDGETRYVTILPTNEPVTSESSMTKFRLRATFIDFFNDVTGFSTRTNVDSGLFHKQRRALQDKGKR